MPKKQDNPVQEQELKDEKESEAIESTSIVEDESEPVDEVAEEVEAVEESTDTNEVMPAEIAAINTDNETAKAANKEPQESKEIKNIENPSTDGAKKGTKMENEKFTKLITEIEGLTTLELADLVKVLEERFGVSAAAPMMAAAPAAAGGAAPEAEEEKTSFTLVLADSGAQKIAVIKALREINQELGLKEAKDLADGAPKEIKKDMPKVEAEEAKKKLEAAGAKAELK